MTNKLLLEEIRKIIDEKLEEKLDAKFNEKLQPIKKELVVLKKIQKNQGGHIKQIKTTLDLALRTFDKNDMHVEKRVRRVEDELHLPPIKII